MLQPPDVTTTRHSPLLERPTETDVLDWAPAPWRLVQCRESALVFLENPPAYEALEEDLAWEKTFEVEKKRRRKEEPVVAVLSRSAKAARRVLQRRERIEREVLRQLTGRHGRVVVCDVGCGTGTKLARVCETVDGSPVQIEPHGVEISVALSEQSEAAWAPWGGHCVQAPAVEGMQTFADGQFDLIILCSFLEHEVQPLSLLREVQRTLNDHGRAIIKVPNLACWNRRVRGNRWCGFRHPDHVNYFTPSTLRDAVERASLTVVRSTIFDRFPTNDNQWMIVGRG